MTKTEKITTDTVKLLLQMIREQDPYHFCMTRDVERYFIMKYPFCWTAGELSAELGKEVYPRHIRYRRYKGEESYIDTIQKKITKKEIGGL